MNVSVKELTEWSWHALGDKNLLTPGKLKSVRYMTWCKTEDFAAKCQRSAASGLDDLDDTGDETSVGFWNQVVWKVTVFVWMALPNVLWRRDLSLASSGWGFCLGGSLEGCRGQLTSMGVEGGYRRGEKGIGNVLYWCSRHKNNTHGVGVTRTWAPAGHNNNHITRQIGRAHVWTPSHL